MRVRMLSFHLSGSAYSWYRCVINNNIQYTWENFLDALLIRFGQNQFYDPKATLKELKQTSTVAEYQNQFEELSNQVTGLSEEWLISLFVAELHDHLKCELLLAKPTSYVTATLLARLHEQKLAAAAPLYHKSPTTHTSQPLHLTPNIVTQPHTIRNSAQKNNSPSTMPPSSNTTTQTPNLPNPNPPFRKLTASEIKLKREKGLCYHCEEKWSPGHRCKTSCYRLIGEEEWQEILKEPEPEVIQSPKIDSPIVVEPMRLEISFNTMVGQHQPTTFRLKGTYKGQTVMVLIDGGNTHNFVKARVAEKLEFPIKQTVPLQVLVGNGDIIGCRALCEDVPLVMKGYQFNVSTFVLELQGADVVLEVQWLMYLGYVTTHYGLLTMEFIVNNTAVKLQGERLLQFEAISNKMLQKMVFSEVVTTLYHMKMVTNQEDTVAAQVTDEVQQILNTHEEVFAEPSRLPPYREIDHKIHLVPGSQPVSVQPYKYPHFQKEQMERLVAEMLETGVIRESQSAYSSLVLLVRKKDGSWRFCVDYRALNAITIKEKFHIPTIEEILDELFGAEFFSKIDLRTRCHQIRMSEDTIPMMAF
ncbi:uncharacterized protein LOC110264971 [Arachis ipaensis]|uniref:uncharacterized protein LOC110264971 n=1 Tax=Arachis ipaensis TaxID=130454 RepID=UPI000A2B718B|nr:uncharacterized protein LOC110264971 [Arachis ipaensis]